jgi:hypothetical protein
MEIRLLGRNGYMFTPIGGLGRRKAYAVAIQKNGKIVAAGYSRGFGI